MKKIGVLLIMLLMLSFVLMQATLVAGSGGEPPGSAIANESSEVPDLGTSINSPNYFDAEKAGGGEPPGGHISPAIDSMVTVTIIPLLVLIVGLFWKGFDKNRFTKLLLQLWGLIKDADNFFTHPDPQQKRLIDDNGLNAAKKIWVEQQAKREMPASSIEYLKKKTGSLGNAIEMAINVFKFGGTIFGVGKKLVNVFK